MCEGLTLSLLWQTRRNWNPEPKISSSQVREQKEKNNMDPLYEDERVHVHKQEKSRKIPPGADHVLSKCNVADEEKSSDSHPEVSISSFSHPPSTFDQ